MKLLKVHRIFANWRKSCEYVRESQVDFRQLMRCAGEIHEPQSSALNKF